MEFRAKEKRKPNQNPRRRIVQDELQILATPSPSERAHYPNPKPSYEDQPPSHRGEDQLQAFKKWKSKYKAFSQIQENKRLSSKCDQYHHFTADQKAFWQKTMDAQNNLKNLSLAVRPAGFAKTQCLNGWESLAALEVKDEDGECYFEKDKVLSRLGKFMDLSQKKNWGSNNPTWNKYHYYGGGMQCTDRFEGWKGQVDPDGDCVKSWFSSRQEERPGPTPEELYPEDYAPKEKQYRKVKKSMAKKYREPPLLS